MINSIFKYLSLLAIIMLGSYAQTVAQSTATASTTATIVTPISIAKTVDMVFGNIATNGAVGTVTLLTDGSRTSTGGVTLPATTGSPTAAAFVVTGSGSFTYSISLPGSAITLAGTTAGVTVGTFTSNPTPTGTLTAGTQTIYVGATLNLPVSTVAGSYTNAAGLSVTVNYN